MDQLPPSPEQKPEAVPEAASDTIDADNQKMIRKITRLAAIGFLLIGMLVLLTGGSIILGATLMMIGIVDIVLIPHILETIITAQLKNRNNK